MIYLFSFAISILILVFVHEFGHYYVAIKSGVKIEQFSIGLGKELWSFVDKRGTKWSICLFPLGGYVRMYGDINPASLADHELIKKATEEERKKIFALQPLKNRFAIVLAGPLMNYLLAILLISGLFFVYGKPQIPAVLESVIENSAAFRAGLRAGDKITQFDGNNIENFYDLQQRVFLAPKETVEIKILRDGEEVSLAITTDSKEVKDSLGNKYTTGYLGVSPVRNLEYKYYNIFDCMVFAVEECIKTSGMIMKTMGQIFTGVRSFEELGGPIRIAQYSGELMNSGIQSYIWFLAFMSINLGFINLVPLPMLDGGHLMYFLYELVAGKPLSKRVQEIGFKIGYIVVIFFTVLSFSNDIKHLLFN